MKKNHSGLWIGISAAIIVLIAGGVLLIKSVLRGSGADPDEGTRSYTRESSRSASSRTSSGDETSGTETAANVPATSGSSSSGGETTAPDLPSETEQPPIIRLTLSEEDLIEIAAAQETLDSLRVSPEYRSADSSARAQQVLSVLETLSEEGSVDAKSIYYDEIEGYVSYTLSSGVLAVEELTESEDEDGSAGLPSLPGRLLSANLSSAPLAAAGRSGFADAVILNGMTDRQGVMDRCRDLQTRWTQSGLQTDLDTSVTLDDLANLAGYEFVYVKMHGICTNYYDRLSYQTKRTSLIVLEQRRNSVFDKRYEKDLLSGGIVYWNGCYSISPAFIQEHYHYGDLAGNIFFLGCCELLGKDGVWYDGWTDAFADCSLSAFVAFHNSNYTYYNLNLVDTFVQELLSGRCAGEAYDAATAAHGKNDAEWNHESTSSRPNAGTPAFNGDYNASLEDIPDWRSAYYGFILQKGYLSSGQDYDEDEADNGLVKIAFALHDMDEDGVPELIANAGYYWAGSCGYIYTVRDGKIVYLGSGPENRSTLYYSPDCSGFFEKMDPGPAVDPYGRIYNYGCWSLENGLPAYTPVATEYSDLPPAQIEDEGLYSSLKAAQENQTDLPWLTPEQISEMGWDAFIEAYYQRCSYLAAARDIAVSGLTPQMAQAYLNVLPEQEAASGEKFSTAAFPDLNDDGIPEMLVISYNVTNDYGFPITKYTYSLYSAESGTAKLLHQDYLFDFGGPWRTACRIYQVEGSSDLIICRADYEELWDVTRYSVLSYSGSGLTFTELKKVEEGAPYPDEPSSFEFTLNGENISEAEFLQYESVLNDPIRSDYFHGSDGWPDLPWENFFGGRTPAGLSRSAAVRILTAAGAVVQPKTENVIASGSCGENVSWILNDEGTLRISGNGGMEAYYRLPWVPWTGYSGQITAVVIEDGVRGTDGYAFSELHNLKSIRIGNGISVIGEWLLYSPYELTDIYLSRAVTEIEAGAFAECGKLRNIYYAGTEAEWLAIQIGADNGPLYAAELHLGSSQVP